MTNIFRMKSLFNSLAMTLAIMMLSSCEFVGEVVSTGFYSGIFLVVLIFAGISCMVNLLSKKK